MSTKSDGIGVNICSSGEGSRVVNDGKVEASQSKTLVQNSGYLCQVGGEDLVDGNKVLEESKVFVGEERLVGAKSVTKLGEGTHGMCFKTIDRFDETKNRVVEMMSRDDGWGSWGVMNLVGKMLGGKLCMDEMEDVKKYGTGNDINSIVSDEVEDAKKFGTGNDVNNIVGVADDVEYVKFFENGNDINIIVADEVGDVNNFGTNHGGNCTVDFNVWQNVTGEPVFEDGRVVNETIINTDLDSKLDCSREGAGFSDLNKYGIGNDINSIVADEAVDMKELGTETAINSIVAIEVEDVKQLGTENDINSTVADEVEDVKNFVTDHDGSSDVDWNVWQNVINEIVFEDGRVVNETIIKTDLDSKLNFSREGADLSRKQHSIINKQMPDGGMESKGLNNVNSADVLLQSGCGEESVNEREGECNVSDLVWGKVRTHPWWPGQILPPSAASEKAMKHFKKDTYLVAYFGDQTFAWNELSKIKPFRMHFSEMEKQSDAERFCRGVDFALDEVARRVELGLSCQCLPKEVHIKIKSQVIQNAGVKEESSIGDGGDYLSTAASFVPGDFLKFLKSLAEASASETDRLQFGITKAQFLAFSRWKGCYQLWTFQVHGGLMENDSQFIIDGGRNSRDLVNGDLSNSIDAIRVPPKKRKSTIPDLSSRKCKQVSNDELLKMKERCIPVLTTSANLSLQDDEKNAMKSGMKTAFAGKKRGLINSISNGKRAKKMSSLRPSDTCSTQAICSGDGSEFRYNSIKSTIVEMIPAEFNPDEILLKFNSAAVNPMQGYFILSPIIGLLRQIRNLAYLERPHLQNANNHSEKSKGKKSFSLETRDLHFEGTKDSYWTDRVIQGYSQERVILGPKIPGTKDDSGAELEANIGMTAILDNQKQEDSVSTHFEAENSSAQVDERSEEYFPTALLLNFTNFGSIPSVEGLNKIFRRYGPLDETETKILSKSKRAKIVFMRRADAEAAFSSTGKYSIFGPSLLSYRLHCAASKARAASKEKKNAHP